MRRPEVLAPAGDRDALAAALAAGADAVYLGLDDGFNARARAVNFASDTLPELVSWIHRAGARLYVTLNTLVFEPELPIVEALIRRVAAAGTDAIIVQDPAVALIAQATCPALEVHASTQMTASSPLAVTLLAPLGLSRVVVPRELSVDEIRAYAAASPIPLEVFVHGALCVAWSGQCLSSEAWGGRSANRGQCAQACRLPYSLVVDGAIRDLGEVEYLLSPKDLVGDSAVPALTDIGVASFKIEGRLKGPHYVATTVAHYRRAIALALGQPAPEPAVDIPADDASLHVAYSRGISPGFLSGADHQSLVEGRFPRHRGLPLGRVVKVDRDAVFVVPDGAQRPNTGGAALSSSGVSSSGASSSGASSSGASSSNTSSSGASASGASSSGASSRLASPIAPRAGMGVVFDAGRPEDTEQGGPIFSVDAIADGYRLRFGNPGPDLSRVRAGDFVWISSDPKVTRAGEKAAEAGRTALGRIGVELVVRGSVGEPLEVTARALRAVSRAAPRDVTATSAESNAHVDAAPAESRSPSTAPTAPTAPTASTKSDERHIPRPLEPSSNNVRTSASALQTSRGVGLSTDVLTDKLGAFGGTDFHLAHIDTSGLASGLHVPVSELKELRRAIVADLEAQIVRVDRVLAPQGVVERLRASNDARAANNARVATLIALDSPPTIVPLCRNDEQLDAVLAAGAKEVELDWMELVGLAKAVTRAKAAGARVGVATVRVQKPGEERIDAHLARLEPDWVLVRSWGSLAYFKALAPDTSDASASKPALHADFSLNVTNSITAGWVLGHGLETITAAHDLDREQLMAMLDAVPRGRVAVTVHHHIPTFHTEHCVYAHLLSKGADYRTCGRPCEQHAVSLKDRVGLVHPVIVDVGCRNTVFNAQAQSAAGLVPELIAKGVRRMRIELVRESGAEARRLFEAYTKLAAGEIAPAEVVRRAEVHEQFGVTRGTMRTLTVLR